MKLIFDKDSDRFKLNLQDKSFEWSYYEVDIKYQNIEYNLIIIASNGLFVNPSFYERNIKPCINISITQGNKLIFFHLEDYSSIKYENSTLKIGEKFNIKYGSNGFRELSFQLKDSNSSQILEGYLSFLPIYKINNNNNSFSYNNDGIEWGISCLKYKVNGYLNINEKIINIKKTIGYHDYNYCLDANTFYKYVNKWIWWKIQTHNISMIYFELSYNKKQDNILLIQNNEQFEIIKSIDVSNLKYKRTPLFLRYPSKIKYIAPNILMTIYDACNLDYTISFLGIKLSGLFYTRRKYIFNISFNQKLLKGIGTFEMFKPKLLKHKIYRYAFNQGLYKRKRNILSKFFLK